jgi:hypothetical protein
MVLSMPRPKKAKAEGYGEKKKNYSFMLTPTASDAIEALSEASRLTRSEYIERVARGLSLCDEETLSAMYRFLGMAEEND